MIKFSQIGLVLSKKCQSLIVLDIQRALRPHFFSLKFESFLIASLIAFVDFFATVCWLCFFCKVIGLLVNALAAN